MRIKLERNKNLTKPMLADATLPKTTLSTRLFKRLKEKNYYYTSSNKYT